MSDLEKKFPVISPLLLLMSFFFLSRVSSSQNFFFSSPTRVSLSSSNHHARNDDTIDDEERVCATQRRKRRSSRRTRTTTTTTTSGKERAEGDYCIIDFVFFGIRYRKNERDRENDDYSKRTSPELALFDVRRRARVSVIWCFVTVSSKCGDGIHRRPRARLWKS